MLRAVVGELDLEVEGWAVPWGQFPPLLSLLDPPRGCEAHDLYVFFVCLLTPCSCRIYENGLLEGRVGLFFRNYIFKISCMT